MTHPSSSRSLTAFGTLAAALLLLAGCGGAVVTSPAGAPPPPTTAAASESADPPASRLAAGSVHSCVVTGSGGLACWGSNESGQLGDGTTTPRNAPVLVPGLSGVRDVAAGATHTCALTDAGGVLCWGGNADGQLGDGTRDARPAPVGVVGLASGVRGIAAGSYHTCAVTDAGGVVCWGAAWGRAYEDGGRTGARRADEPSAVGLDLSGVVALAAGESHTCALTSTAGVRCWGWNGHGQLGDDTRTSSEVPVTASGLGPAVRAVAAGWRHTCAVADSTVWCWGANESGQLGDGTLVERPTSVGTQGLTGVVALAAGDFHTCALGQDGSVACWGLNDLRQLGVNTPEDHRTTPVTVAEPAGPVSRLAAGAAHSCALVSDTVLCWGSNEYGQLGGGSTASESWAPVEVLTIG